MEHVDGGVLDDLLAKVKELSLPPNPLDELIYRVCMPVACIHTLLLVRMHVDRYQYWSMRS
jgi:hypothetical protein